MGQGQTAPRGKSFDVNTNVLSFHSFVASFQKNVFESMFPLAFVAGWLQGHWWGFISQNYIVWPTFFLTNVFIALKGSHFWFLFEVWLHIFFHDLIHVYSPGAGADSPQGTKFWCQQKCLVTSFICCKFQKISVKSDFIRFFFSRFYTRVQPQGRGWQPLGDEIFMSTETSCHFGHLLQVSKNLFEVWFYTVFFSWFYTCI